MPIFETGSRKLYYEVSGSGFPLLLFAPGGMRSSIPIWARSPWNPIERLAPHFKVIAMDQRNAGQSTAPISATDGWHTYTQDHLDLLDHLNAPRCHVLGGCIGGAYCMAIAERAPRRIASAVLQQTIGYDGKNREAFYTMFDGWAEAMQPTHPLSAVEWQQFRERMYGTDFVFSTTREFAQRCQTPLLLLMGDDQYHPQVTSREIARLAPRATLIERWKEGQDTEHAVQAVIRFLQEHTPR